MHDFTAQEYCDRVFFEWALQKRNLNRSQGVHIALGLNPFFPREQQTKYQSIRERIRRCETEMQLDGIDANVNKSLLEWVQLVQKYKYEINPDTEGRYEHANNTGVVQRSRYEINAELELVIPRGLPRGGV